MILDFALLALLMVSLVVGLAAVCICIYSFAQLLGILQKTNRSKGEKFAFVFLPFLIFTRAFQPPEKHKYIGWYFAGLIVFSVAFGIGQLIQRVLGMPAL